MTRNPGSSSMAARTAPDDRKDRFATLTFERDVAAPLAVLWQAWTAPAARRFGPHPRHQSPWSFLRPQQGGRTRGLALQGGGAAKYPLRGWLAGLQPALRSVNYEAISSGGVTQSVALVTADFSGADERSRLVVTVQLSSLAENMEAGYRQGFGAGLDNLSGAAERTMVLERVIQAPRTLVWGAWMNPETLPQWWGPDGFSCRTTRIDLRTGGEWVFDMIAPDGAVYPNHHRYGEVRAYERIGYTLLWGENGPKHADAWASFEDHDGCTKVTLGMIFSTAAEFQEARGFGAVELGLQTLGKLERFVVSQ